MQKNRIENLRNEIDELDRQIISMIFKRSHISRLIGEEKRAEIFEEKILKTSLQRDSNREAEIKESLVSLAKLHLGDDFTEDLQTALLNVVDSIVAYCFLFQNKKSQDGRIC